MDRRPTITPGELDLTKSPNKIARTEEGLVASGTMRRSSITPWDLECMLCDETADPKALPLLLLEEITNDFSDQQKIGSGGFAVVYKGMLENRAVAVKMMSDAFMDDKEFHREVECLMMVKHKNVVRFLGYCADTQGSMERYNGKFVMADIHQRLLCFEYLPKGSLDKYIIDTSHGLRWRDCFRIIKGICHGLHYLHQNNIVHLDLKPANILLDDNWVPKITDFGISRYFDEMQSRDITKIVGTFGYLAPESFNHTKVKYQHSYRLDIYSLGVVIIEILTGEKGYHDVEKVIENWSNKLEKLSKEQLEQVRLCIEIGIECIHFNPEKRPDTEYIISRLEKMGSMGEYIKTDVTTSHQINPNMLIGTMKDVWLSYQQLNPDIRRCIEYSSVFPKGSKLETTKLVFMWIAQGFVKTICATEDMEDVAEGYIQELVSYSFLHPDTSDGKYFIIDGVLHDLLDMVVGNCFRIENARCWGEGGWGAPVLRRVVWEGDVPRDVEHLFVLNYDAELITERVLGLPNLLTLIIYVVHKDTPVEKKVIKSIGNRLPKLRVLAIASCEPDGYHIRYPQNIPFPKSISQLKHLRYLALRIDYGTRNDYSRMVILPSALNKHRHIQVLDFGNGSLVDSTLGGLVTLRHIICNGRVELHSMNGLISLQTMPHLFYVRNEQGYEVKQLRDLNKLRSPLHILDLENVKSKEDALQANLSAKERLTELGLRWGYTHDARCTPEVEAEVLEGLRPPVGLQILRIERFEGSRYPDWMVGKQNGGPRNLQNLVLWECGKLGGPAPELVESFPRLRRIELRKCGWETLPSNMEHLAWLKELEINSCKNIRFLPTLPQSLEELLVANDDSEFSKSCRTIGHPNCQKIEHVPNKRLF